MLEGLEVNYMSLFSKENGRVKRSVDLSPNTDVALDTFRSLSKKHGVLLSRGAAINAVLGAILRLSPEMAARLHKEANKALKSAQDALDATSREDALSRRSAADTVENWKNVVELFDIIADGHKEPAPMRSIAMDGRHLLVPDAPDWILVNESKAAQSTVATIVEIKNGTHFNAPHFVYFDNGEAGPKAIDAAILAVYPGYKSILAARIEPVKDSDGNYLNLEELKEAPMPGYFPAQPNDPAAGNPYGVVIIPEKGVHE